MTSVDVTTQDEVNETAMRECAIRDEERALRLGWWLALVGFGGFLLWALLAPLDKGVAVAGNVVVSGNRKVIQHMQGGIIDRIQVKEGDRVVAGQVLLTLNAVDARTTSEGLGFQYDQLIAREARLLAEQRNQSSLVETPRLVQARQRPEMSTIIALQADLLRSRQLALKLETEGVRASIDGMETSLSALQKVMTSKQSEQMALNHQLQGLRPLATDNYIPRNKMLETERMFAQVSGELAQVSGEMGRTRHDIQQQKLRIAQRQQEYDKEVNSELSDVQARLNEVISQREKADFNLANVQVRAPVAGTVVDMKIFTEGGVIAPGQVMMEIVPEDQPLLVDGRIPVEMVDKIRTGLPVELQFTAFSQSTTPRVPGTVTLLSADRLVDEKDGTPYYSLRIQVSEEGRRSLHGLEIKPGMPVQGFVRTGERSFINYLFKPLMDRMHLALTEE
ncbi:HlyD family type I secretion periplasmic adaptor subunit [Dickeya poaceiphila]|uniref:Membrane fusion protein (MFP) family protein n=1 Tax=Dickeya poaceiphila TaxID=568768 RepID=A0A5B8HK38_9GAMM|nr:HlyD family type I secretion periplasmic adaptor subunit [Dickeya poaceiphila]QDX30075.1 HlyD family type I secretion periplasmic adaptor subunit [Dickeya poaceiphila]